MLKSKILLLLAMSFILALVAACGGAPETVTVVETVVVEKEVEVEKVVEVEKRGEVDGPRLRGGEGQVTEKVVALKQHRIPGSDHWSCFCLVFSPREVDID